MKEQYKHILKETLGFILNLAIILGMVFCIRMFIISPFQVSGASMTDTLEDKEYIIVNKFLYHGLFGMHMGDPQRGDIVVIVPPIQKQTYYIKRVIGLPGETIRFENNNVTIINKEHPEGFILLEEYLRCVTKEKDQLINTCDYSHLATKEFIIPEDQYFVMGDNRMNSTDSRVCFSDCNLPNASPFVNREHIVGKTWLVMWPLDRIRIMGETTY